MLGGKVSHQIEDKARLGELDPGGHAYILLGTEVQGENGVEGLVRNHLRDFRLRYVCHDVE